MSLLKGFTDELKATAAVAPLGIAANELLDSQVAKAGKFADSPIRLYAAFPTPDTKLYFRASAVVQGDGSSRIIPAIDDKLIANVDGSLDFQSASPTIAGITLTRDGSAYTHPPADLTNKFVRVAFVRKADGSFDSKASAGQTTLGAAQAIDPGTLWSALDGLPNGYVDLECTAVGPLKFKTAGSATAIIENSVSSTSRIFNVGAGGGAGGGADRTYKISAITATVATIKGGYRGIDDKRVLSSGAGTTALTAGADVSATMATLLTQSGLSFVANKIYALVIDLTTVSVAIALDNLRQVITWTSTNLKLLDQANLTLIDPRRYVLIDQIFVPSGATDWATAGLIQWTTQVHDTLTSYFPNIQRYATQITSASASNILTHGLDAEPQIVQVFYYDGVNKNGKDLSSHLINKNATQLNVSSFGLTFGGGQYLEVTALHIPTVPNIASASRTFNSQWFTSNAVTTVPHGLSDMEDIRGYAVHEWDTAAAKRKIVDPSAVVINYDATNFYLNWVGTGVSATKQFRIVVGGSPLPWSVPDGQFDSITNRSGAGAPNFPNGATGITTGMVRDAEGAGTTALNSGARRHQVFNLTAARTVVLPSTSILKGDVWIVENRTLFTLSFQAFSGAAMTLANGSNMNATVQSGWSRFVALQDAPTAPGHWLVEEVQESGQFTMSATGPFAAQTVTVDYSRSNRNAVLTLSTARVVGNNVALAITLDATNFPISLRPVRQTRLGISVADLGTDQTAPGLFNLMVAGNLTVERNFNTGAFQATAAAVGFYAFTQSYTTA